MSQYHPHADPHSVYPATSRRGFGYGLASLIAGLIGFSFVGLRGYRLFYRDGWTPSQRPARPETPRRSNYDLDVATSDPGQRGFWEAGDDLPFQPGHNFVAIENPSQWTSALKDARLVYVVTTATPERIADLTSVRRLRFSLDHVNDDVLKHAAGLKQLTELWLSGKMTGAGLKYLTDLKKLRRVHLGLRTTIQGLENLRSLPALKELSLCYITMAAEHINIVQSLPLETFRINQVLSEPNPNQRWPANLKDLQIVRCSWVGDRELNAMTQSKRLETLVLYETQVTNDGMGDLVRRATGLKRLWIRSTLIGANGLQALARLTQLEEVVLDIPVMRDADFVQFSVGTHPRLRELHLVGGRVSARVIKAFRHFHPVCRVTQR